jgi:MFS family permease
MALIAVPGGLGFGLGLWLVGQDGKLFKEEDWIRIGLFTLGGGLALTSFVTELRGLFLLFYALVSAVTGAGFAFVIVSARTYVQRRSPDEMRGRVLSTQLFLSNVASTLPLPIVGGLADAIGFRRVFVVLALIVLIAGVLSLTKPEGKEESWEQSKTL